jgi:ABC-type dipeptide/oligopeptide/nickel transport system ATPase component
MVNKTNPLSIKSIEIKKLFGYYDYEIPSNNNFDLSQLLIIYGDNGSGKTTILKMLFWLLSTRNKSGYKTKLAQTKFEKISIKFHNGAEIGAIRKNNNYIGEYNYYVKKNNKNTISLDLKVTPDITIDLDDSSEDGRKYLKILEFIKNLNISVFYLSDDRKILNSINSSDYESYRNNIILNESDILFSKDYEKVGIKRLLHEKKVALEPSVDRLFEWVRTKVISGSKTGEKNSQVIFTDLIKNVFTPNKAIQQIESKNELIKEIENVESRVGPYVKLGLIEKFDSKTIKETITLSKDNNQLKQLQTILAPYIESINAKLEALEKIKDTLNAFISSINNYFTNKTISFHLNTGFKLKQNGEEIEFSYLSSGEKQLLLLFINTITSAEIATIFIIDEPEISLNIKWQRNLIDTLLKFSNEKNIQYILSTHSLELLSTNIDNVTKLENLNGSKKEA